MFLLSLLLDVTLTVKMTATIATMSVIAAAIEIPAISPGVNPKSADCGQGSSTLSMGELPVVKTHRDYPKRKPC